ncbi:unnamed protein product [Paramecium primaurelia]|uniref:Uncharacterized protein n=1 Tax=Paramecium primaurelia TaxID=5886 RepID=A0A8S1LSP7_PARPR|nr:unnamed protein product [Paramecium primaurelia]
MSLLQAKVHSQLIILHCLSKSIVRSKSLQEISKILQDLSFLIEELTYILNILEEVQDEINFAYLLQHLDDFWFKCCTIIRNLQNTSWYGIRQNQNDCLNSGEKRCKSLFPQYEIISNIKFFWPQMSMYKFLEFLNVDTIIMEYLIMNMGLTDDIQQLIQQRKLKSSKQMYADQKSLIKNLKKEQHKFLYFSQEYLIQIRLWKRRLVTQQQICLTSLTYKINGFQDK